MVLIGVDQGTTGTRTVAFDERLEPVAEAYRRVAVTHPQPGWISKDAREVVRSVSETVAEVVAAVGGADRVDAIGLDNEGETVVAWDPATGEPLADAVVWGCRRSQPIVERLAAHGELVERRSGLPLDPYFTSTKIRWLIENAPGVDADTRFGTLDAYVTLRLGDGARTDPSTAARTQLQALAAPGAWDAELCGIFGVDPALAAGDRPVDRRSRHAVRPAAARRAGRPDGRARGPRLPRAGHGEGHVRHGHLRAPERGHGAAARSRGRAAGGRVGARRRDHVRARRRRVLGRHGDRVAGRGRARPVRRPGRDGGARELRRRHRGRRVPPRAGRSRRAVVALRRARRVRRADGRRDAGAPRPRGARRAVLPRPRRGRGDVGDGRAARRRCASTAA